MEASMNKLFAAALTAVMIGLPGAALAQHMDINAIIAGIGGGDFLKAAERVDSAATVRVVRLSTLAGAAAAAARLDDVSDLKSEDLEYLHANLYLNPMARMAIRNAGLDIRQIVSVELPSDNAAVVYANDLY
jgi:hypothetical protein